MTSSNPPLTKIIISFTKGQGLGCELIKRAREFNWRACELLKHARELFKRAREFNWKACESLKRACKSLKHAPELLKRACESSKCAHESKKTGSRVEKTYSRVQLESLRVKIDCLSLYVMSRGEPPRSLILRVVSYFDSRWGTFSSHEYTLCMDSPDFLFPPKA